MFRENRRKVVGVVLGMLGLLATSASAPALESPLDRWHVQSTEFGRFWQQAWSSIQAILACVEHSSGIDPNGEHSGGIDPNGAEHGSGIDPNG